LKKCQLTSNLIFDNRLLRYSIQPDLSFVTHFNILQSCLELRQEKMLFAFVFAFRFILDTINLVSIFLVFRPRAIEKQLFVFN